jgi:hypothetical protein
MGAMQNDTQGIQTQPTSSACLRLSCRFCTSMCGSENACPICQDESNRASDHLHLV